MSENVIPFPEGTRRGAFVKAERPQMHENMRDRVGFTNHYERRAFLRMFMCGATFRAVARKCPGGEDGFARLIRGELYDKEAA